MVWERSDSIALVALIVSTAFSLLNYLYTRKRTQNQPRILISSVKMEKPYIERDNQPPCCRIRILFRNSGKISTMMYLKISMRFEKKYSKDFHQSEVKVEEISLNSGENLPKAYIFDLKKGFGTWSTGYLYIGGYYLGYKDKERQISIRFKGRRELDKEPVYINLLKTWKPEFYMIEEDSILGYLKMAIWSVRLWRYKRGVIKILAKKN